MKEAEILKETIEEMLGKMRFEGQVLVNDLDKTNILVNISTPQAAFLIGPAGVSLDAFQCLARVLVNKKLETPVQFLVDVNNYRHNRFNLLKEMARKIAKQALVEKVAITLSPMPSYERRVVHLALIDHPQISTESVGAGFERRIVVRPIE